MHIGKRNKNRPLLCFLLWSLVSVAVARVDAGYLKKIDSLLKQRKYNDAYQLAQNFSAKEIGNPAFDLLLGKTALRVKKPSEAILAFKRVLMNYPNNASARLGLATAYYDLGIYSGAKTELRDLTYNAYASGFAQEIQSLRSKIGKKYFRKYKPYSIYGRIVVGFDDNVSAVTDDDYAQYLSLAGFNTAMLNAAQQVIVNDLLNRLRQFDDELRSPYVYPQLGARGRYFFNSDSKHSLIWDINGSHKEYAKFTRYNVDQANASLGIDYQLSPLYLLNGTVYYQEYLIGGSRFRESPLGSLSLSRVLSQHNLLKFYFDGGLLIYPNNRELSLNLYVGGLEWLYSDGYNTLVVQGYYGRNQPRAGGAKYNGSNYYGADLLAKRRLTRKLNLTVGATYQDSLYDDEKNPAIPLAARRKDRYLNLSAGLYYNFHPNYTWYILYAYTNNNSTIFLHKYDRNEYLTGISFEF